MSQIQKYLEKGPNLVEVTKTSEGWEGLPKRAVIEGHAGCLERFGAFCHLGQLGKGSLFIFNHHLLDSMLVFAAVSKSSAKKI